jgi:hypothetical protein
LWLPLLVLVWIAASIWEWRTGQRIFPWSAYQFCGSQNPEWLPATVTVGLYEEFPVPWRLEKLRQVDFPVKLAVAATSREEFVKLRADILQAYPQVREVYFWPLLPQDEGYYPGTWSEPQGVERLAQASDGVPVLWDLELPRNQLQLSFQNWWHNRVFLSEWLRRRKQPVHIWRSNTSMGLDPLFLRLAAMHFDPLTYPAVSLHLDLYMTGSGMPEEQLSRILRCGVERYHERFIPSLGVLDDGEGSPSLFVPPETLRRNLQLVRESGVQEVWLFGANGLNSEYMSIVHETLPLEKLAK